LGGLPLNEVKGVKEVKEVKEVEETTGHLFFVAVGLMIDEERYRSVEACVELSYS
jgi:hypothetical protein